MKWINLQKSLRGTMLWNATPTPPPMESELIHLTMCDLMFTLLQSLYAYSGGGLVDNIGMKAIVENSVMEYQSHEGGN